MRMMTVAAAMLIGMAAGAPGAAAREPVPVKIALRDMSATMGMGTGMMGRGMMSGPMARDEWSQGQGQGGWMGHGVMRPGMAVGGMMAIRTDHAAVDAGPVRFDVTNWSRGMLHEMMVVAVDSADAPLPYDYAQGRVVEDQVRVLGETTALEPNASAELDLELKAGSYLLLCNLPGHYAAGMAVPLTVLP